MSGQTSDQIAARQGGAPAQLSLPGNQLPASGPVLVEQESTFPITPDGPGPMGGTLAGVHGTLTLNVDASSAWTLYFTRDSAGQAVPVPPQTPFHPDTFDRESGVNVFWIGGNNFWAPDQVLADTAACVAFLNSDRYIVMSLINAASAPRGSSDYNLIVGINGELAQKYPGHYLDIRSILVASYDPNNPQDVQDHANDVPPSSLRNDDQHPNQAGYAIVAQQVAAMIQAKGW